ncbi:hypothetical protein OAN61_00710 [bacterium]|nr:hypothetical protein [bacterium]
MLWLRRSRGCCGGATTLSQAQWRCCGALAGAVAMLRRSRGCCGDAAALSRRSSYATTRGATV